MSRAFSVLYWTFAATTIALVFLVALVLLVVTLPFDRRRIALHLFCCAWGSSYVYANPIWRLRVEGREHIPWRGGAVLVANHLSLLDILVLYALFRPFKWVAKEELFRVPIIGWIMRMNDYVRIRRGDPDSVRQMLAHCERHLSRGSPVLLFPEGTRSPDGRLRRFKDGAFRLALDAGVPVVPIAIAGTYDGMPKQGLALSAMRAHVRVLPPISPADRPSIEALRDEAHAAIAAALPPESRPDR